jgi:hypothetical protein
MTQRIVGNFVPGKLEVPQLIVFRMAGASGRETGLLYAKTVGRTAMSGHEVEVIPPPGTPSFGPALETEKISHTGLLDVCNATRSNEMQKRGHH